MIRSNSEIGVVYHTGVCKANFPRCFTLS
uniref:Uncharacterized protein n=1 Tax=Rhizophora mucronata TaxID=61149 RepID=A0A2P2N7V7_RHIMU